ncbi:MAG: Asparagine synthetase, partial [Myxococcaceae bacterium]|nr:Asparagine synthetase [Myxococcaceae bacterium]
MCGIAGVLGDLRGVSTTAMLDAIAHRGPDADGTHTLALGDGAALWLGHRRLAIQDLSDAGRQPMLGHDGRRVIVFNGEIYNFKELRETLTALGERFVTGTDTEVILAGFRVWGEGALDRFRGMFAFALYDPDEGTLTLARDRLGEKPLYYHVGGDRFAFASEVRALTASGVAARELDPDGLDAYLTFGSVADPYTLVRNVRSVAAGEVVVLRRGLLRRRRYWSLSALETPG